MGKLRYLATMQTCPHCQQTSRQSKNGFTKAGSQRYKCIPTQFAQCRAHTDTVRSALGCIGIRYWALCDRKYTPSPHVRGYPETLRRQAIRMYVDGLNFRRIGRHLGVNHQTVINWVSAQAERTPAAPVPASVRDVEMDELFTFIGDKKTKSM